MQAEAEGGLNGKVRVKILLQTGENVIFDLADTVKIDEKTYKKGDAGIITALKDASDLIYDDTYSTAKGGSVNNVIAPYNPDSVVQLARYKTNINGEITFIDTIVSKYVDGVAQKATVDDIVGDNALFMGEWGKNRYRAGVYMFGKFFGTKSTIIFAHPEMNTVNWDDEEHYKVLIYSNFVASNSVLHLTLPFYTNDDQVSASYILYEGTGRTVLDETAKLSVVKDVTQALVGDKVETVARIVGGAGAQEIYFESDFKFTVNSEEWTPEMLQIGDILRASTNFDGYVEEVELYYRIQDGTEFTTIGTSSDADWYNNGFLLRLGYPYKVKADGFTMLQPSVAPNKSAIETADLTKVDYIPYYNKCTYIVYDDSHRDQTSWVSTGTYNSILSYEAVGNNCVQVFVQANVGRPETIIIIRKGSDI